MALKSHNEFIDDITEFDDFGKNTIMTPFEWEVDGRKGLTMKAVNEYWTSGQRQANSLHEISYRACFKPQLPEFFIARLTEPGDGVYDKSAINHRKLLLHWTGRHSLTVR